MIYLTWLIILFSFVVAYSAMGHFKQTKTQLELDFTTRVALFSTITFGIGLILLGALPR